MSVIVYVEGPSDGAALGALLKPLLDRATVGVRFIPLGGKAAVLEEAPRKAAGHLSDAPQDWVFALPDLYPTAQGAKTQRHGSAMELKALLQKDFNRCAEDIGLDPATRAHFRPHCLKHDLEALVLAAPEMLRKRLATQDGLKKRWRLPVETQDNDQPPKRIVEALFGQYCKRRYQEQIDAPWILARTTLEHIEAACPECFRPFVDDLRAALG